MPVYDPEKHDSHVSPDPGRNPGEQHEKGLESKFDSRALSNRELRNSEESKNAGWYSAFKNGDNGHSAKDTDASKFGGPEPSATGWKPSGGPSKTSGNKEQQVSGDDKRNWFQRNRRRVATFTLLGFLLGGAGAGIVGTASGPFKIIHAGQILRGAHLKQQEDAGDSRFVTLARYIRSPNKPQNLRLGIVASAYADRIEKNMNKNGITSTYTEKFGYLDGYQIDKSKFKGGQFNDLAGKSNADITKYFKERFNVEVVNRNGQLFIDGQKIGYLDNIRFNRGINEGAGYSRINAAIRARVMGQRAGISWHPMVKLDRKILTTAEARYKAWQEKRDARIKNGVAPDSVTTTNDAEEKNRGAADEPKGTADDIVDSAKSGDVAASNSKIQDVVRGAGGATAAVGLTCLVHGIASNIDNIQQSQVIKPIMRMGMEFVSTADQIMFGGENNSDVDLEQIGNLAAKMDDPKTGFNFFNAKSVQAEIGEKAVGPDADNVIKPQKTNPFFEVFGNIPGLDSVCKAVTSTAGQVVTFGISFIGGPVTAVVTEGAFRLLGPPAINAISRYLAGNPVVAKDVVGPQLGNYANYGVKYAARDVAVSGGGQELNGTDTLEIRTMQDKADTAEFREKSLAYQLFNPYDYRTVASKFIDKQQSTATGNIAALARGFLNFGDTLVSLPKNLATSTVGAAGSEDVYDYGFKDAGFSDAEMSNAEIKDPYKNACIVVGSEQANCKGDKYDGILQGPLGQLYMDNAKKCFGINLDVDGNITSEAEPPTSKAIAECHDGSLDWLRVRFYIFDTQLMEANGCFNGDDQSCQDVNFNGGAAYVPDHKNSYMVTA